MAEEYSVAGCWITSAVSPGCEKWRAVVSSSSLPPIVIAVEVPACRPWGKIVFKSGFGSCASRTGEHRTVNAKKFEGANTKDKGNTGIGFSG